MKKILTAVCLLAAAGSAAATDYSVSWPGITETTRAGESADFSYAGNPKQAYSLKNVTPGVSKVHLCVKMRQEDVVAFRGNAITALKIYGGTDHGEPRRNPCREVTVFITPDLEKLPANPQKATLKEEAYSRNTIELETPYEISPADTVLYFGYTVSVPEGDAFYIPTDATPVCGTNFIFGISDDGGQPESWVPSGMDFGSLCLTAVFSGDKLPQDLVSIYNASFPTWLKPGDSCDLSFSLRNSGINAVSSVELTTTVGDEAPIVKTIDFNPAIEPNGSVDIVLNAIPFNTTGFHRVSIVAGKVNGNAVSEPAETSGALPVYSTGYDRNLVMEEGTGTWCGWCPAGMVMLEYIADRYADRFFAISIHSNDRMTLADYQEFMDRYFTVFPISYTNRSVINYPGTTHGNEVNEKFVDDVYARYTSYPAYCRIGVDEVRVSGNAVNATVASEFTLDCDVEHHIAFVLTENGVGPYVQSNYYSGGYDGNMGGWESLGEEVETTYDDIPRAYKEYTAADGVLPLEIKAGQKYSFTAALPLEHWTGGLTELTAFITNASTGEIVNACRVPLDLSGVESIEAEEDSAVRYFTLQGVETVNPGPGIYIRLCGGEARKVIMK